MKKLFYTFLIFLLVAFFTSASLAMRIAPTRSQLAASPELIAAVLQKITANTNFDSQSFSHAEIQYCIDNNIAMEGFVLYSPVLTLAQTQGLVPLAWPGSTKIIDDVEIRLKWSEYTRMYEVTGGYVLQYRGTYFDTNNNISLPTNSEVRAWIGQGGGFLTQLEVDAIRVVAAEND